MWGFLYACSACFSWGSLLISHFSVVCGSSENILTDGYTLSPWVTEGIGHCYGDAWLREAGINFSVENTISWHTCGTCNQRVSSFKFQIYIHSSILPDSPEMVCVCSLSYGPPWSPFLWCSLRILLTCPVAVSSPSASPSVHPPLSIVLGHLGDVGKIWLLLNE